MDVPISGRSPLPLDSALTAALDADSPADERDPFVYDTDSNVRWLGRVAVRRSHIDDVFALGDACAQLTFNAYDAHMSASYAEKALTAYRRAQQVAETPEDRATADAVAAHFVDWTVATALQFPSRRNISVALWAAALLDGPHASHIVDVTSIDRMLAIYRDRVTAAERRHQVQARADVRPATHPEDATRVDLGVDNLISQDMLPPRGFDSAPSHTAEASAFPAPSSHMASSLDITPEAHFGRDFGVGEIIEGVGEVMTVRYGGMGVVYLCYDHERNEPAAVKTFQGRFWNNKRAETRFHKEALTWIQLEKHPNIVQARRVHTVGGRPHIVLEHVSGPENLGPDLSNWIKHRRVTLENAVDFALQIARAMRHAAAKFPGMVHRDIKPANILVTHDGTAKVTDFGLVYSVLNDGSASDEGPITADPTVNPSDRLTRADAVVGTYAYMSPEQWVNDPSLDLRSDIYAFGCVLYEMLVGKTVFPYRHKSELKRAHLEEQPEFDEVMEQKIPLSLRSLVLWCLEKDREERPQTWDDIADVLRDITVEITGSEPIPEPQGVPLVARELVDKGYSLTELGRYDQALQAFDQAIAKQPGLSYAWARKGRTLRLLERYDDALVCYDRALEIQPAYAWALSGKGVILERMGRFEEALECFRQASEMHPEDVWYVHNMGSAYFNLGQLTDAEQSLRRAVEIDPAHSSSWARLGQVLRQLDRPEEALGAFEQAIKLDPTYAWAHNGLGLTQKMLGRTRDALNSFLRATRYQPNVVMHWYSLTEMYIDLGQVQDALDPARRATELDPNYALSWAKLGQVLRYLKRYDEALSAYDRALSIDPGLTWAVNGRGVVLEQTGRYEEALECYRQAAEQAPDDVWYLFNQGNVLLLMDRSAEAIEPLRHSVEMDPASARFWTRLGKAYRQLGDYERALDACRTAVRLADQLASAWSELGATLEAMEQHVEALDAYRRAVELSDDPFYTTKQTDLLSQIGKNQTAAELLEQALQRDPNNGQLWGKYGQALRRLRRLDEAMVAYSRAIDLDPDDAWAWGGHGLTLGEYGRHAEALKSFDRALELNQDDPWLWYNRAEELLALNRAQDAIESLQHALALRPDHAESWAKRGHALRKLGKLEDALVAFDKAVQVMPGYAWAWNGRALTLRELRRRDDALISYQRAVREDPNNLWYRINQIDLLLDMRKAHEALQVATTLIDYAADSSVAWARHGQVLRRLHRYQDALGSYERALLLDSRYAWAWNGKGMSLYALERYDEALSCYEQATTLAPGDPWFWYNYGEALMRMGDIEGAKRRYRSALQADPRHQASKERLNEL